MITKPGKKGTLMIKKRTDTVACPESYAEYTSYNNLYMKTK